MRLHSHNMINNQIWNNFLMFLPASPFSFPTVSRFFEIFPYCPISWLYFASIFIFLFVNLYRISYLLQHLNCQVCPVKASVYILFLPLCGYSLTDWLLVLAKRIQNDHLVIDAAGSVYFNLTTS
jgi:hypothetical protein